MFSGCLSFPYSSVGTESACNAGDPGSVPGSGRSPGEGKGYPLQYSGLEDSMDGIPKTWTWQSDFPFSWSICFSLLSLLLCVCLLLFYKCTWYIFYATLFPLFFYWSIVDLQCCINFCCTAKWFSYTCIHIFFFIFFFIMVYPRRLDIQ